MGLTSMPVHVGAPKMNRGLGAEPAERSTCVHGQPLAQHTPAHRRLPHHDSSPRGRVAPPTVLPVVRGPQFHGEGSLFDSTPAIAECCFPFPSELFFFFNILFTYLEREEGGQREGEKH